jgi:hypothetical protein
MEMDKITSKRQFGVISRTMNKSKKQIRYEDLFLDLSVRFEKWAVRTLVVLIFLLLISQSLLLIPCVRFFLVEIERMEGLRFS